MNTNAVCFFNEQKINDFPENSGLILAVWEIINPGNIGQIIRLGHNVGANNILFVNDNPDFRESKIKKTAGFSFGQMNWKFISKNDFLSLINADFQLVVLETCSGSKNIFSTDLPQKAIILAGSESNGIPTGIIEKSDCKIHIPMPGGCKSMNVSQALSVAAFEWYRKMNANKF